jgi:hypothetical protein
VPLPSQWSEEAKADAIITRNRSGNWCNMSRKTRQSMPMGGGMPDGALDSNPHGEDATPNRAQPRRVRTYSRHGNRRPKDFDRTIEYDKRNKKRFDARAKEKEALLSRMYDAAKHGPDQESWVRAMMKKQLSLKQGKAFVPRPRRLRAVSAETHDDGDAGDESEELDNHFDDATEAGGQESRSGRHDPAACDRRTAEEFKHLIECSEGLATNCAYCNRRLDGATWKERLVSREECPWGTYCRDGCSQLHFVMRHPRARSRYDEVTHPCAVSFKPNNMCPCLRDDGESALAAHGTVRTKILSSRGNLSFDHCDLDVFYCCMCEKLFVPDEQDLACQGAIVLCSRSRRDDNDRFAIPGFPVASAIARWNIGWVEDTSTVLVELALLFQLMFSRFGPAHAGIKGFVASEQLAVEDLHGATSTGVISGDMRKHLHHTLLRVTTGYMLASKQADGTLEMKWCNCPLCPDLFAVSIDGTAACSTMKSGNLRHLDTDDALASVDPNQYTSDSLLTSDAQLLAAIHSDPRALARVTAGPCATVRFEANGGPEPSVEELRALNLETLTQQPTRLAFLASCDHRVVLKCVLSPIPECQALVSLVLQSILGHPSYEPFPAGGPLEKKRTNITYDLGCQCGAVEERIAVSAECEQIREKHGEPLSQEVAGLIKARTIQLARGETVTAVTEPVLEDVLRQSAAQYLRDREENESKSQGNEQRTPRDDGVEFALKSLRALLEAKLQRAVGHDRDATAAIAEYFATDIPALEFLKADIVKEFGLEVAVDWLRFAVGDWHAHAHNLACRERYAQRVTVGTGRILGEIVESLNKHLRLYTIPFRSPDDVRIFQRSALSWRGFLVQRAYVQVTSCAQSST